MKLANIYALDSFGAQRGQAATGTTDSECLDVRATDAGGVQRDISQVVAVDSTGAGKVISRRLQTTQTADYKFVRGQLYCPQGNNFNNYSESSSVMWSVAINFRVDSLAGMGTLISNKPSAGNGWEVYINSSGQLVHTGSYNGNTTTVTWTEFTFSPGVWYSLSIYGYQNNSTVSARVSQISSSYYSKSAGYKSTTSTARNMTFGWGGAESTVCFLGTVLVRGTAYGSASTQRVINVSIENAEVGNPVSLTYGGYTLLSASGINVQQHYTTTQEWVE